MRKQLALGGGKLFSYIAKQDKEYLNMQWDQSGKFDCPDHFLENQMQTWSKWWSPSDEQYNIHVATYVSAIREYALNSEEPTNQFDADILEQVLI